MSDYETLSAILASLNEAEWEEMLAAMAGKALPSETLEWAVCSTCDGYGETAVNTSWRNDPQCERRFTCHVCNGSGNVVYIVSDEIDFSDAPEWWFNAHNGLES